VASLFAVTLIPDTHASSAESLVASQVVVALIMDLVFAIPAVASLTLTAIVSLAVQSVAALSEMLIVGLVLSMVKSDVLVSCKIASVFKRTQ